jgi:hypothetical protein
MGAWLLGALGSEGWVMGNPQAVRLIRNDHTLDRPDFRVTAEEVFDALRLLQNDDDTAAFTTCDIARVAGKEASRYQPASRIERSVRAAVFWLCEREVAHVTGHTVKITEAGCVSKPFTYALYPGRMWSKRERDTIRSVCDYGLLMRAFVR